MSKIAALNDVSTESEDSIASGLSSEVLEAEARKIHQEAVFYLSQDNWSEAKESFLELLQNPFVSQACTTEAKGPQGGLSQEIQYKYSCFKNLGNICAKQGDYESACNYYTEALKIDDTETLIWYQLGASAVKIPDMHTALVAFQEGLKVNPEHFPCQDQLLSVLFILQLYEPCLGLCTDFLEKNPCYIKALAFRDEIFKQCPHLVSYVKESCKKSDILLAERNYDKEKGQSIIDKCLKLRSDPTITSSKSMEFSPHKLDGTLEDLTWDKAATLFTSVYDKNVGSNHEVIVERIDMKSVLKKYMDKRFGVEEAPTTKNHEELFSETKKLSRSISCEEKSSPKDPVLNSSPTIKERRQTIELGANETTYAVSKSAKKLNFDHIEVQKIDDTKENELLKDPLVSDASDVNKLEASCLESVDQSEKVDDDNSLILSTENSMDIEHRKSSGSSSDKVDLNQSNEKQVEDQLEAMMNLPPLTEYMDFEEEKDVDQQPSDCDKITESNKTERPAESDDDVKDKHDTDTPKCEDKQMEIPEMTPTTDIKNLEVEEKVEKEEIGTVEITKKPKRTKRGLERELEQLDYWGRRKAREAKRRRRTLTSKLVGAFEENEYLSWNHLLRSFIPAALLCPETLPTTPSKGNIDSTKLCNMLKSPNRHLPSSPTKTTLKVEEVKEPENSDSKEDYGKVIEELKKFVEGDVDFSTFSTEELQVCKFLLESEVNGGILGLTCRMHYYLLNHLGKCWPVRLAKCRNELYMRARNHITLFSPMDDGAPIKELHDTGISTLVFLELAVSLFLSGIKPDESRSDDTKLPPFLDYPQLEDDLFYLIKLIGRPDVWGKDFIEIYLRFRWVHAQIRLIEGCANEGATILEMLLMAMRVCKNDKDDIISVQRCHVDSDDFIITIAEVQSQLNVLQRSQKLEEIQKQFDEECYEDVIEILTSIFDDTAPKTTGSSVNAPPRHTQLTLLVQALKKVGNEKGIIEWGALCLHEALKQYSTSIENTEMWSPIVTNFLKEISETFPAIQSSEVHIDQQKLSKLVSSLVDILVIQLEQGTDASRPKFSTLAPWTLLYDILSQQEKVQKDNDQNDAEMDVQDVIVQPYPSTLFLITAHEELGKNGWCCLENGQLVLRLLDILLQELARPLSDSSKQRFVQALEQATFCLYAHPPRRTKHKHLRDHGVHQIVLTWDIAVKLFKYYCPRQLPDFQTPQIAAVSDDTAVLFKRFLSLIPTSFELAKRVTLVEDYLKGLADDFIDSTFTTLPQELNHCHYLLADYYFKNKEWHMAIHFYEADISVTPDRFLSWAPLGLAKKAQLETLLNSCDVINDVDTFFKDAEVAVKCFEKALELDKFHCTLWVEMGGLVYTMHSLASRLLKQDLDADINIERFQRLEKIKASFLQAAEKCFKSALEIVEKGWDDETLPDERWLYYYMLGKISEKKMASPQTILKYYQTASRCLDEICVKYPTKISYNNPQENAVESLELYYRIMAYILKYLIRKENKDIDNDILQYFNVVLKQCGKSPFALGQPKSSDGEKRKLEDPVASDSKKPKLSENADDMRAILNEIINNALDKVSHTDENIETVDLIDSDDEVNQKGLTDQCIKGLKLCVSRFPHHYKSMYRIAQFFFISKQHKDYVKARSYMLGCDVSQRYEQIPNNGLFSDRKVTAQNLKMCNLFNGIWRIPHDEIDRPGSFAAHMHRCVSLTLDILHAMNQFVPIFEIALSLKVSPEKDKKYLRDDERELLLQHAIQLGMRTAKDKQKNIYKQTTANSNIQQSFLLDIHKIYKSMAKHLPGSESPLGKILVESYRITKNLPADSPVNVLKEADTYCSQFIANKITAKPNPNNLVPTMPFMGKRGRPPGPGKVKAKVKDPVDTANEEAIRVSYTVYENLIRAQGFLQTKDLDPTLRQRYLLQYDQCKTQMLKCLKNPIVSHYFQTSLESMNSESRKVPPPTTVASTLAIPSKPASTTAMPINTSTLDVSITTVAKKSDHIKSSPLPASSVTITSTKYSKTIEELTSKKADSTHNNPTIVQLPPGISISRQDLNSPSTSSKTNTVSIEPISKPSSSAKSTPDHKSNTVLISTQEMTISKKIVQKVRPEDKNQSAPLNLSCSTQKPKSPDEVIILD